MGEHKIDLAMPARIYHADPCEVPSLSQSMAHLLLTKTPKHAFHAHPRMGNAPHERTESQRLGHLHHALLLDRGPETDFEPIRVEYKGEIAKDFRSEVAKTARDEAIARGKEPVLLHKFEEAKAETDIIAKAISEAGCNIWRDGVNHEVSVFWESMGVQCRARIDALEVTDNEIIITDIKSTSDASKVQRTILDYGYDLQEAAYRDALEAHYKRDVTFRFAFYEPEPPYAVRIVRISESYKERGAKRWVKAVQTWGECLRSGVWPGYESDVIECPAWALDEVV